MQIPARRLTIDADATAASDERATSVIRSAASDSAARAAAYEALNSVVLTGSAHVASATDRYASLQRAALRRMRSERPNSVETRQFSTSRVLSAF